MVFDKTGSLAATKRHDYLPFGEELYAGQGVRTIALGYTGDNIRQKFTSKERDNETSLDYFQARYYSSVQGRFTSVDPDNAGANESDPRSWNGYAYAGGNPILFQDPNGREYKVCSPDGKTCTTVSDEQFWAERKALQKDGNTYTGDRDFYESGQIKNADGDIVATYQQISIDERAGELAWEMRKALNDPKTIQRAAVNNLLGALARGAMGRSGGSSSNKGLTFAEMAGTLRQASKTKGNFGMGQATRQEAQVMGEAWVGPGHRVASDGKTLISADGLKAYRPPSYKPFQGKEQANFEWRNSPGGVPTGNGHLDVK